MMNIAPERDPPPVLEVLEIVRSQEPNDQLVQKEATAHHPRERPMNHHRRTLRIAEREEKTEKRKKDQTQTHGPMRMMNTRESERSPIRIRQK